MDKEYLKALVDKKLTQRQIAKQTGKGQSTIRYWLKKYSLVTNYVNTKGKIPKEKVCPMCNELKSSDEFYKRRDNKNTSPYCKPCSRIEVKQRQKKIKEQVVEYMGGKCVECGYDKYIGALHVHHTEPHLKSEDFANFKLRKFDGRFKKELETCVLLCANCHAEAHASEDL